jgi:hypothetical protein
MQDPRKQGLIQITKESRDELKNRLNG